MSHRPAHRTWLIVLNWNGREDTLELLRSLTNESATIVVVDNGSYDGTLEAVESAYPTIITLQTGANLGYAGGNNAGIRLALDAGAEVIGVLNNDTVVRPGFLDPLLAEIDRRGRVAVSPDIRYAAHPDVSWYRGSFIDDRTAWPQHLPPSLQPPVEDGPFNSPVLTGCCIVAPAGVWRDIGLFDDRLFLIFEDSDWSRRAAKAGVTLLVVPESQIAHKVSRSFAAASSLLGTYYFARNGTIFAWRHLGIFATLRFVWKMVIRPDLRRALRTPYRRQKIAAIRGVLDAGSRRRGAAPRGLATTRPSQQTQP